MNTKSEILESNLDYLVAPSLPADRAMEVAGHMIDSYYEPWRKYHTINHLGQMLGLTLEYKDELKNPRRVIWGTIGHDRIYIPQLYSPSMPKGLNEKLSAESTYHDLASFLPNRECQQIRGDILSSATHKLGGGNSDRAFFLDWDMSILGSDKVIFDDYDSNIEEEFSHVDTLLFKLARLSFFVSNLSLKRIFITDVAHELLDDAARENMERKVIEYQSDIRNIQQAKQRS